MEMNNFINIPNKIKTSLIVAIVIKLNPAGGGGDNRAGIFKKSMGTRH